MPCFNNERNNSRRSDGRSAEPPTSRGHGSSKIKQTLSAGLKSHQHHHVLPQHYHHGPNTSSSPKNTRSKGAAAPRVPPPPPPPPISRGRNASFLSDSSHSHGSTSNRGRSLSLARQKRSHGHSSSLRVSKHGEEKDVATATPTSPNEGATLPSGCNSSSTNRRGRSLSIARPSSSSSRSTAQQKGVSNPNPTSNGEPTLQLPLIGTKGERRPRSQSRSSRPMELSSSNTSSKKQPQDNRQQSRRESKADDNLPTSTSRTSTGKPLSSSSSTNRSRGRGIGRAVSKKDALATQQKSFKTVMAENSATSHNTSHNHNGAQQRSSSSASRRTTTTTTTRGSSRGRSNSQGRSKKKIEVAPPPPPLLPVGESIKKDQQHNQANNTNEQHQQHQQATSSTLSATTATTPAASTTRRKFVVEIDPIKNAVVQVYEFSQDGTLPNKQTGGDDRDKKKEPAFIETIRRRYAGETSSNKQSSARTTSGPSSGSTNSRGRSSSRSRATSSSTREDTAATPSSLSHQRNTKIVIESDEQDNVIQIFEFSDMGALPPSPSQPSSCESDELNTSTKKRDASPFTRQEEALCAKEIICQETTSSQGNPPEEFKPTTRGLSQSFTSSRRPSSRAAAAAAGGSLRSSLRTSTKNSEGRNTPTVSFAFDTEYSKVNGTSSQANNVSFALDNDQEVSSKLQPAASLDSTSDDKISEYSVEEATAAPSRRGTGGRSVSFVDDQRQVEHNPSPSFLMSSLNSQDTSYGSEVSDEIPAESSSSSKTSSSSSSLSSNGKKLVSFLSDQNDRDNLEALRSSMDSTSERTSVEPSNTVRRSVSFLMDHQQDPEDRGTSFRPAKNNAPLSRSIVSQGSTPRAPLVPQQAPPTRGRSVVTRSIPNEDLPGFSRARRARSLPRSHCLVINDASSLTASVNKSQSDPHPPPMTRGRSSAANMSISTASTDSSVGPAQPRRQARSLSRTRNPMIIRDHVDFDPTSRRAPPFQDNYGKIFRSDALPFENPPPHAQKSLITSYSTAETYVSALTIEEEEDSLFTNETTQAVKEDNLFISSDDPLMNSTLTVFESECDEDEQSLLTDPTSCMMMDRQMNTPSSAAGRVNGVNIHIMKDDSTIQEKKEVKQERRSKIRQMLSRKVSNKRSVPSAQQKGQGKVALDTSESTRETQRTEGSGDALVFDSAQNSLRQQHHHRQSGKQKSRLTRLLKR